MNLSNKDVTDMFNAFSLMTAIGAMSDLYEHIEDDLVKKDLDMATHYMEMALVKLAPWTKEYGVS